MLIRNIVLAASLGLGSLGLTACVDDGYRRPGLVVVDPGRGYRDGYRDGRRYDRGYDRHDRRYYRDRRYYGRGY